MNTETEISLLRLDAIGLKRHIDLTDDDICYYWREYTSGRGFDYSKTNDLIKKFQIPISETHRKYYKEQAIEQLAEEFIRIIPKDSTYQKFTFVPMPPSKLCNHPEYDDRLTKLLEKISRLFF